jgi:putative thiamine transport system permease protein
MGAALRQLSLLQTPPRQRRWHRPLLAPSVTVLLIIGPVLAGLLATLWPALARDAWTGLWQQPGLRTAVSTTLLSGVLGGAIALLLAGVTVAAAAGRTFPPLVRRLLGPLVAMPHAAFAIGLAFLLAPSGWLVRLVSPWLTGWTRPPDIGLVGDGWGLTLAAGLALREAPFLVMVMLAAAAQINVDARLRTARALGYTPVNAWLKTILPALYPQIRLPLYAVLAYGLSAVDMAMILGPNAPPTLAVLVTRWSLDADFTLRPVAAAGAVLQTALVVAVLTGWMGLERLITWLAAPWLIGGGRGGEGHVWRLSGGAAATLITGVAFSALFALALWSVAGRWPFPQVLPGFSARPWMQALVLIPAPALTTAALGAVSTMVALVLVLACLETEAQWQIRPGPLALWLLYLPLLVPQIGFVFGLSILMSAVNWQGHMLAVAWSHVVFVLPYVFLTLADPYRALDPRLRRTARALGAGHWRCWWGVVLPSLCRPVLLAAAVGFAVSVALYLPTLQIGAGRIATLSTEAVTLAGGGDRRIVATLAFAQLLLPALVLGLASLLPTLLAGPWQGRAR